MPVRHRSAYASREPIVINRHSRTRVVSRPVIHTTSNTKLVQNMQETAQAARKLAQSSKYLKLLRKYVALREKNRSSYRPIINV